MKWPMTAGSHGLIGVEVSTRWLKAFQASGRAPLACARVERRTPAAPFSQEDANTLAGVLDRAGFHGRRIVLVPPRDHLIMEVVELPPKSSGAPLEQLARGELARTNRIDPASFELAWWELPAMGRPGDQSVVFAVALPLARSEPMLDACEAAGLHPEAIDAAPNALARSYGPGAPDAMLDVSWTGGMLCAVHSGTVVYERTIEEAGLRNLIDPIATRLGIPPDAVEQLLLAGAAGGDSTHEHPLAAEFRAPVNEYLDAMCAEVHRSLAYMAHRHPQWHLRTLGLTGDGACLAGLSDKLTAVLGVGVVGPRGVGVPFALAAGASAFGASRMLGKGVA